MYQFSAPPETLREREVPLEPRRVMSVFKKRVEKHKEELAELEECEMKIRSREVPVRGRRCGEGLGYHTVCAALWTEDPIRSREAPVMGSLREGSWVWGGCGAQSL